MVDYKYQVIEASILLTSIGRRSCAQHALVIGRCFNWLGAWGCSATASLIMGYDLSFELRSGLDRSEVSD